MPSVRNEAYSLSETLFYDEMVSFSTVSWLAGFTYIMVVFHPPWPYGHDFVLTQCRLQTRDDAPEPIEVENPPEYKYSLAEFMSRPWAIKDEVATTWGGRLGVGEGGAGEGRRRKKASTESQGDVAGRSKRRRDGYTSRVPARSPSRIRGARHKAGQSYPQSACRRHDTTRDQVCILGITPQDRAHDLVEFTADCKPCGGAGSGIAFKNSSSGVIPVRKEALRAKAIEESVGAI